MAEDSSRRTPFGGERSKQSTGRSPFSERGKPHLPGTDRDLSDITSRLQHQVNELVERVTGVRQAKRQYLTMGLTVGVLVGLVLGILVGMLMHALTEDHAQ